MNKEAKKNETLPELTARLEHLKNEELEYDKCIAEVRAEGFNEKDGQELADTRNRLVELNKTISKLFTYLGQITNQTEQELKEKYKVPQV